MHTATLRQVVLDTETTGTDWKNGDRIIEIGAVELIDRRATGQTFQRYLNPDRDSHPDALRVHGLTTEFLSDKPRFHEVVEELLAFVAGAELVIHNAAFDIGFLDAELARLEGYGRLLDRCTVEDTLVLARQRFPGQRVSLDALCKRLGVDNSQRELHGALLDAQILTDMYLALTSWQGEIGFAEPSSGDAAAFDYPASSTVAVGERPRVRVADEEQAAHAARLAAIRKKAGQCLWSLEDANAA